MATMLLTVVLLGYYSHAAAAAFEVSGYNSSTASRVPATTPTWCEVLGTDTAMGGYGAGCYHFDNSLPQYAGATTGVAGSACACALYCSGFASATCRMAWNYKASTDYCYCEGEQSGRAAHADTGNVHGYVYFIPTPPPTPAPPPTPPPTLAPTAAPTPPASAGSTASSPASAKGDPHLQNVGGQRFDLMRTGWHVMVHIPRGAEQPHVLFHVAADAQRAGPHCGDVYFKNVKLSGAWVEAKHNGTLQFHAEDEGGEMESTWITFGAVDLKVARGHNQLGVRYFNLYFKHLGSTRFKIGGLLGEDDHEYEATPDTDCTPTINLHGTTSEEHSASWSTPSASSAEASLV